jgi:hypothetical protein
VPGRLHVLAPTWSARRSRQKKSGWRLPRRRRLALGGRHGGKRIVVLSDPEVVFGSDGAQLTFVGAELAGCSIAQPIVFANWAALEHSGSLRDRSGARHLLGDGHLTGTSSVVKVVPTLCTWWTFGRRGCPFWLASCGSVRQGRTANPGSLVRPTSGAGLRNAWHCDTSSIERSAARAT